MILLIIALVVAEAAMVSLATALGLTLAYLESYRRALKRLRATLAEVRAERNDALDVIESLQNPQVPVWTTGAPAEAIDAEFEGLMHQAFFADGSDQ